MAQDTTERLVDLANRLTAIGKEIQDREEAFERDMLELRQTRAEIAQELQALTRSLIGDVAPPTPAARARRAVGQRQSPEAREEQVLDLVRSSREGLNGKEVAQRLGVSNATATKAINALLQRGAIRAEGARRNRKLFAA